jgi:hypothetical protein
MTRVMNSGAYAAVYGPELVGKRVTLVSQMLFKTCSTVLHYRF